MFSLLEKASWIWVGTIHEDLHNDYADFRYDFSLAVRPKSAPFYITADQCYMLYLNGRYVCRGPARGFQNKWAFDEVDLVSYLRQGHNWISVRVYNAGVGTFQYIHQKAAGLICTGLAGRHEIISNGSWIGRRSPAYRKDTARLSLQLNFLEWFDAREDDQSWIYSKRKPSGWDRLVVKPFGRMPWHTLEPRGIPNLSNSVLIYSKIVSRGYGPCGADYKSGNNPAATWYREQKKVEWVPLGGRAADIAIPASGKRKLRAVILDMGRPTIGTLLIETFGVEGGEIIDFFFCEVLNKDLGPVILNPEEVGSRMAMSLRLILGGETTRHESFQMRAPLRGDYRPKYNPPTSFSPEVARDRLSPASQRLFY